MDMGASRGEGPRAGGSVAQGMRVTRCGGREADANDAWRLVDLVPSQVSMARFGLLRTDLQCLFVALRQPEIADI